MNDICLKNLKKYIAKKKNKMLGKCQVYINHKKAYVFILILDKV